MSTGDCPGTIHSTPQGLNFSVYCGLDATNIGDLSNTGADSLEECLDRCVLHTGGLCGAAAFDSNTLRCFFKDTNVTASDVTRRQGWSLGIANPSQLQPMSSECGGNSGRQETTKNDLDFTMYCNQDVLGNAICTDANPICRAHTSTLEECLEFCSTNHPLCTGVAWRPDMQAGYLNCDPKNATARDIDNNRVDVGYQVHSAKAMLQFPDSTSECTGRETHTLTAGGDGPVFELSCNQDYPDDTLATQHMASLDGCVAACADFAQGDCAAAVFDAAMVNGYENCYLKNGTSGSAPPRDGFTLATRQDGSGSTSNGTSGNTTDDTSDTNEDSNSSSSGDKAWIAGPVVGAVVAIALVVLALLWWRRRRRSRGGATAARDIAAYGAVHEQEPWMRQELEAKMQKTPPGPRYELDTDRGVQELDAAVEVSARARKP